MIVFDLQCLEGGETFEAWFRSNADFDEQNRGGLVQCPYCASSRVTKAPMAPSVPRKGLSIALEKLAEAQKAILKDSRWVGDQFAETARKIHSGEMPKEQVHGQATLADARSLIEDGVPVAPLPLPVVPPTQVN